ncbi:MAG TPA: hypothetical protein VL325_06030, partial [Pyrinomonadaceae bacterium]|nr:hypothetical protein [Pyrinomonadaceae bacterium]
MTDSKKTFFISLSTLVKKARFGQAESGHSYNYLDLVKTIFPHQLRRSQGQVQRVKRHNSIVQILKIT